MNTQAFSALLLAAALAVPLAEANPSATTTGKAVAPNRPAAAAVAPPAKRPAAAARINLNTANASQLAQALNGVGQAKAEAIVAHRKQHGPFKSVAELTDVKGIGPAIVERNLDKLSVR